MPSGEAAGVWRPGQAVSRRWSDGVGLRDVPLEQREDGFAEAWTDSEGRLHLARDLVGHRSLYWSRLEDGGVAWGTRLRDVARERPVHLDSVAILTWLSTAYVPGDATLLREVRAVGAGEELVFDAAGAQRLVHAALPASPAEAEGEDVLRRALRGELERAVDARLPEGEAAATLSGGIDSSLVVALVRRRRPVRALSVTFGPEHRDELAWSGLLARHVGATHEVVEVRPGAIEARFDEAAAALSEPNGDPLTVPNLLLFERAAARGHAVVFNGEGGDPCFGGPKNAPMLLAELYGGGSSPLRAERDYLRSHQRLWADLDAALEPSLAASVPEGAVEALVTPWLNDPRWPGRLDRWMALNVAWKGAGHILPKVEHLAGRFGVSPASPLFDRRVVELAFRVPGHLKRAGAVEKHLLKRAVEDLVPREIIDRPKSGMMVPVEAWLQGPLRRWSRERLLDGLGSWGIVRRGWLEALWDGRLGGLRPRYGIKVWMLLTLESWLRQLPHAPGVPWAGRSQ